jgi:hypothetical protein
MIPPLDPDSGNLPPGIHPATWEEVKLVFGTSGHRRRLLGGLRSAAINLRNAGCTALYLDGSFVSSKTIPGDFDGCWDPRGMRGHEVDPVLLDFSNQRARQKVKYGGELFPASIRADAAGQTFLEFFQVDKDTGAAKGIISLDLASVT